MSSIWNQNTREEAIYKLLKNTNNANEKSKSVAIILNDPSGQSTTVFANRSLIELSSPKLKKLIEQSPLMNSATIKTTPNAFREILNYIYTGQEWKFDGDFAEALELSKLSEFLELEELVQKISSELSSQPPQSQNKIEEKLHELNKSLRQTQAQQLEARSMIEMTQNVLLNLKLDQNLTLFELRTELRRTREEISEMRSNYEGQLENSREELAATKKSLEELSDQLEVQKKVQHSSRIRTLDLEAEVRNIAYQLSLTRMELCDSMDVFKETKQSLYRTQSLVQDQSKELKAHADEINNLGKSNSKNWECLQRQLQESQKKEEAQKSQNQLVECISADHSSFRKDVGQIESQLSLAVSASKEILTRNQTEIERISVLTKAMQSNFEEQKSRLNRKSSNICFLYKSLNEVQDKLKNFENCKAGAIFPKGFLYFQFPFEIEPTTLWPELKWERTTNSLSQFCACGELKKGRVVTCRNYFNTNNNLENEEDTFFNLPDPRLSPVSPKLGSSSNDSHNIIVIWRRC